MRVIFKYELMDETLLPKGAVVLKAGMQGGIMYIWALIDPNEREFTKRGFLVVGTGQPFEHHYLGYRFIDTIFDGPFVWHVWEVND